MRFVGLSLTLAAVLSACAGAADLSTEADVTARAGSSTTTAPPSNLTIRIRAFVYELADTVPAGATVTVVNEDHADHSVTADDGSFSVFVAGDATATFVVPTLAGTYPFYCRVHPDMRDELRIA